MKLSQYNALNQIQKNSMQISLVILSATSLGFAMLNALSNFKEPLIIERGCDSTLAKVQSSKQTKEEIENFIKLAIAMRFDTNLASDPAIYLIENLQIVRNHEQTELLNKGINQKVIVRSFKENNGKYFIEADRLISVDKIRTAVPLNLVVEISSKMRSISNPYGLVLTFVDQIKDNPNDK